MAVLVLGRIELRAEGKVALEVLLQLFGELPVVEDGVYL